MSKFEITKTELVWPGKYNEDGSLKEVPRVSLPFQVIETVNESRATRELKERNRQRTFFDVWEGDKGETFETGWKNKLIWGDNLLVMGSLLEKFSGKFDLIYIDPPFATGGDFSFQAMIGDSGNLAPKQQSIIEEKAYRDTWGRGEDSYIEMIVPRLKLLRELLSEGGVIFLHLGVQVNHFIRVAMEELFGKNNIIDEIVWSYGTPSGGRSAGNKIIKAHEYIICATRQYGAHTYNKEFLPYSEKYINERFIYTDETGRRYRTRTRGGNVDRQYLDESKGVPLSTVWSDIKQIYALHLVKRANEDTGYQTQKPEALLRRIIEMSSSPGDLVADFFCGSGTTLAVAEKLGRRWIGCDLGRWGIHVTRKRLLEIENCKPFEVMNLGKYERQHWQGVTFGNSESKTGSEQALYNYLAFILRLFGAKPVDGLTHLHGKKGSSMVHIGAVDTPITIDEINNSVEECIRLNQKQLTVLGWEWEMGIYDLVVGFAKQKGVHLMLYQIPREVMETQAVDKGEVTFFELAYLEARVKKLEDLSVKVELKDFVIPTVNLIPEEVENKIVKWSDYIDYWAIDWDFKEDSFRQGWVTYRTRKDRKLNLESDSHKYEHPGNYCLLVKVIDIFGNDTSQSISIEVE